MEKLRKRPLATVGCFTLKTRQNIQLKIDLWKKLPKNLHLT